MSQELSFQLPCSCTTLRGGPSAGEGTLEGQGRLSGLERREPAHDQREGQGAKEPGAWARKLAGLSKSNKAGSLHL